MRHILVTVAGVALVAFGCSGVQKAMNDLNKLESDALKNARQADQATKDAQGAIDDLLGGGGVRVPGGGTTPNVPNAPTVPIVDDAVQKELQRIKDELKRGA